MRSQSKPIDIESLYGLFKKSGCVTSDSRTITPGCLFFAFKGEHFDGNVFARQALESGAACAVVSDPNLADVDGCIYTDNVLHALQQLALRYRRDWQIPVIGITGTNGKTTTKELVCKVLSKRFKVHATKGNLNNHLGVPLTILSKPADAEIAIIEMGASHPDEIEELCDICLPTMGIITNIGVAHIEGFGSKEEIKHTKTALYRHLAANAGTLIVNSDDDVLLQEAQRLTVIPGVQSLVPGALPDISVCDFNKADGKATVFLYGSTNEASLRGSLMEAVPFMRFYVEQDDVVYTIQSHMVGGYNFANAMAAVASGCLLGVSLFDAKEAIEEYIPSNMRSQYVETPYNRLLLDCYNANPISMNVALDTLEHIVADKKMVILGGMKEMGKSEYKVHKEIVDRVISSHFDRIILVGIEFEPFKDFDGVEYYPLTEDVVQSFTTNRPSNYSILIKGSNSNKLWLLKDLL